MGSHGNDYVGGYEDLDLIFEGNLIFYGNGVQPLPNGNYVVLSPNWNGNIGAATWGNGASGVTGVVSSSNSLVGSTAGDGVGGYLIFNDPGFEFVWTVGFKQLPNGNYLIASGNWNGNMGAVTWASGTGGVTGVVSSSNSLVGSYANDYVGLSYGDELAITTLSNGNYVVASNEWNSYTGAVTWGSGASGVSGVISSANSLVGSVATDGVGSDGVTALTDGNYVVNSPYWNGGGTEYGAVTWGSGISGVSGAVSSSNSLVGSHNDDKVGDFSIITLSNGNYVAHSTWWNGSEGAVTIGNDATGITGMVSAANSILGPSASAGLIETSIKEDPATGLVAIPFTTAGAVYMTPTSPSPNLLTFGYLPGTDFTMDSSYLASALGSGTNVTLQANNDITVASAINVTSPGGNLTLQAGRSILVNASITTDGGSLTLYANEPTSAGTVDANRDAGTASITMASGAILNTGTGALDIELLSGSGLTNHASGDITLYGINAGALTVINSGPSNGNITFNNALTLGGTSTVTGNGTVTFDSTVNGGYSLAVNAGSGAASFDAAWGGTTPLGAVSLTSASALSLPAISAVSIFADATGASADLTLTGQLTASGPGTAVTLVTDRNFINSDGASAISLTGGGRWLVYSTDPTDDTTGGLTEAFHRYSCTYGGSCPAFPATGNGMLYSFTPTLTVTANNDNGTYGSIPAFTASYSGLINGDSAGSALTGSPLLTSNATLSTSGNADVEAGPSPLPRARSSARWAISSPTPAARSPSPPKPSPSAGCRAPTSNITPPPPTALPARAHSTP